MSDEGKLVPILREGVEIVKIILFKELRDLLRQKRSEWDNTYALQVTAAVVNELFGVQNLEPTFVEFCQSNRQAIDEAKAMVGVELASLRIPLTDALRTMVLCDYQEGRDSSSLLQRAQEMGVLLGGRELPLPNQFVDLVRRLGTAMGILQAPK
ncbi:MAG: hypothetical protein PHI06_07220 [Desulfobulbaceae bacterium]|nr:hypothetical protein [Desulfobulbaceae bacterium]